MPRQWYKKNLAIQGATASWIEIEESGAYSVKTTVEGCASEMSSDKAVVITASADAAIVQHSLNIFENPVKDRIELEIVSDVDHYVTCEVIDLMGRTVASKIVRTNTSQSIDMSYASDGYYIVRATSGLVNFRARILKGFSLH